MPVEVTNVEPDHLSALRLMAEAYERELTRFYPYPSMVPEMDVDVWLWRTFTSIWMIEACGAIAGFAVLAHDMNEPVTYFDQFYVMPCRRRGPVPMIAATKIVRMFPGKWFSDVLELNRNGRDGTELLIKRTGVLTGKTDIDATAGHMVRFLWETK